ncbi:MAG: transketolase C-terminal domain-containing protein [Candidatus Gottesmanbacteria bacterium]
MRLAFVQALTEAAKKNKRIILVTGDLGFSVFEEYISVCPNQYINAGIAEQNMTGLAAGLAIEGFIPFVYSIIPFVTMRNFEQIRNDICYQNLNVKLVGVGVGFTYGPYGHTHHGLEDVGILRTLPNMVILGPGDPVEARLATEAMVEYEGPSYMRIGRAGDASIHQKDPHFQIGKGIVISRGYDISIIATSTMLHHGFEVSQMLTKVGITVRLVSMHTIKPIDEELIDTCMQETKAIFTLEEHSVIGGLGSAVAEFVAEHGNSILFKRIAVPDRFTKVMGNQEYMRRANKLSVDQIIETIRTAIHK